MKLGWKYFVIEPKSKTKDDPFARAARAAMEKYAETIDDTDAEFASEIREWICSEKLLNDNLNQ